MAKARGIDQQVRADAGGVRLRLECSSLDRVDPPAARALAHTILAWAQDRADRSIDILNLGLDLQQAGAWHPLRAATDPDEWLFTDPDLDPLLEGARPSRH